MTTKTPNPIEHSEAQKPGSGSEARCLGSNGEPNGKDWFRVGLSLLTVGETPPQDFMERFEEYCIPGTELRTGDIVVFYKGGDLYPSKTGRDRRIIDVSRVDVIRFGVTYENGDGQLRVLSQDQDGKVWDHSIEELPSHKEDDWDFYGLRIPPEGFYFRPDPRYPLPIDAIEAWLPLK